MKIDPIKLAAEIARRRALRVIPAPTSNLFATPTDEPPREWPFKAEILKMRLSPDKMKWAIGVISYPTGEVFFSFVERGNSGISPARHAFSIHRIPPRPTQQAHAKLTFSAIVNASNPPIHRGFTPLAVFFSEASMREAITAYINSSLQPDK